MLSQLPSLDCMKAEIYMPDCYYITLDIGKLVISMICIYIDQYIDKRVSTFMTIIITDDYIKLTMYL